MPKLSLQVDDLAVESFETSRGAEQRGADGALYATLSCKPPCNSFLNTNCPEVC
jgi:hypothetical protein